MFFEFTLSIKSAIGISCLLFSCNSHCGQTYTSFFIEIPNFSKSYASLVLQSRCNGLFPLLSQIYSVLRPLCCAVNFNCESIFSCIFLSDANCKYIFGNKDVSVVFNIAPFLNNNLTISQCFKFTANPKGEITFPGLSQAGKFTDATLSLLLFINIS